MHKLDKYCRRFTNDFIISNKSRYYKIGNHILRISDHIGNNSSGLFSIIIKENGYLLHHPGSGSIEFMNYEQIKGFVKIFAKFPLGNIMGLANWKLAKNEQIENRELVSSSGDSNIVTNKRKYPLKWFTKSQRNSILQFINQRANEIGTP